MQMVLIILSWLIGLLEIHVYESHLKFGTNVHSITEVASKYPRWQELLFGVTG